MTTRTRERELRKHTTIQAPEHTPAPSGESLAPAVAQATEARFGHSFADVRVHADAVGDRVARDHDARALTVGTDLFFRAGEYAPATQFGARVLTHELAHVIQQSPGTARPSGSEAAPLSDAADDGALGTGEAEQEARVAGEAAAEGANVTVVPGSVAAGTAQAWPWDDDQPTEAASAGSGSGGSLWDSVADAAGGAWNATKGAAVSAYDGYQKSTDFKPVAAGEGSKIDWSGSKPISLPAAYGAGIDWWEKSTEENNKKAEESVKGIPVLEQLAQASSFISNTTTNITGGVARGVGDLGFGVANAFMHPIDALSGVEGILEHNSTVPFLGTTLKAAHGAYDIATGNEKGEYGTSWGELGNHLFNPLQQQKDDANFNSGLARGIVAPGTKDWDEAWGKVKENPADMLSRAATNVLPIALGIGEAAAGEGAAEAANAAPKSGGPVIPEPPPTLRTPYLPEGVPAPKPFNPDIPVVGPGEIPPGPKVINPGGGPVQINPTHPFYPDAGAPTVRPSVPEVIPDTLPGGPEFPKPPGEPITPQPAPKLPGGPKEGPPIPREEPPSGPVDTPRQPMDIPFGADDPLPSTKPRPDVIPDGPITQDAPPSSQRSDVPTQRGLGPPLGPSIPRGMDPGALIQLLMDTPGGKSVTQLLQELGMPIEMR